MDEKEIKVEVNGNKYKKGRIIAILVVILFLVVGGIKLLGDKGTHSDDCSDCGPDLPGVGPEWNPNIVVDEWSTAICSNGSIVSTYVFFANYIFKDDQCRILDIDRTDVAKCVLCGGQLSNECKSAITSVCSEGWFVSDGTYAGGISPNQDNLMTNQQVILAAQGLTGQLGSYGAITKPTTSCTTPTIKEVQEPTCNNQVYDGTQKTLVNGTSTDYTFSNNTKQTNAGTYTITATLKDKTNSKWKNSGTTNDITLNCSITPKTVQEPTCNNQVYDGTEKTLVNGTSTEYTFSNNTKQTNPGTYTITATLNNKTNYKWKNSNSTNDVTLNCSITAPQVTVVEEPTCNNQVYDGKEKTLVNGTGTEYTFSNNTKQTNAGTYTITVTLKDKIKYKWKNSGTTNDVTLKCNITPKTVQEPTCNNQVYDGTEKTLVNGTGTEYTFSNNTKQTNVGTYDITATLKDKTNYKWKNSNSTNDVTLKCSITAPQITVVEEPTCNNQVYDGKEKTLVNGTGAEYTFSNNTKQTNVGTYTITATLKDKIKYKWKNSGTTNDVTLNCSITPKTVQEPTCNNQVYDGTEKTLVNGTSTEYTFSNNTKQTNAGTYDITATLKDKTNYKWKNSNSTNDVTLKCSITAPEITVVEEPTCNNQVYDGTEKTLVNGTGTEYTFSDNIIQTEVGTYKIKVSLNDKIHTKWKNHETTDDIELSCSITPKPITIKEVEEPTCNNQVYDGSEKILVIGKEDEYTFNDEIKHTKIGTYTIHVSLKDKTVSRWKNNGTTDDIILKCSITGNVIDNPQTGMTLIVITYVIGALAIGYTFWYLIKIKKM